MKILKILKVRLKKLDFRPLALIVLMITLTLLVTEETEIITYKTKDKVYNLKLVILGLWMVVLFLFNLLFKWKQNNGFRKFVKRNVVAFEYAFFANVSTGFLFATNLHWLLNILLSFLSIILLLFSFISLEYPGEQYSKAFEYIWILTMAIIPVILYIGFLV